MERHSCGTWYELRPAVYVWSGCLAHATATATSQPQHQTTHIMHTRRHNSTTAHLCLLLLQPCVHVRGQAPLQVRSVLLLLLGASNNHRHLACRHSHATEQECGSGDKQSDSQGSTTISLKQHARTVIAHAAKKKQTTPVICQPPHDLGHASYNTPQHPKITSLSPTIITVS